MNNLPLVLGIALNVEREQYLAKYDHLISLRELLPKDLNHEAQVEIELLVKSIENWLNNPVQTMA